MTDQKTPDGTQEHPGRGSETPAPPEGQNEPQTGAQSLQGEQPRGPVDWARQQAAERAAARVLAALHRSAEADVTRIIQLAERWQHQPDRADALRELTEALRYGMEPASSDGPSVKECAAADRIWPLEKAGE